MPLSSFSLPIISVLMPVFNGERFLKPAMDSILAQTYRNFEFIVINDGSTDESLNIVQSYKELDSRIRIVTNNKNQGLISTLNAGMQISQGKYIARMDCDDFSLPTRFAKQVAFLESHPDVGVCGTWYQRIGRFRKRIHRLPTSYEEIRQALLFRNPICHPSVMLRNDYLDHFNLSYDTKFIHAEDFNFWSRCSQHFPLRNIGEVLLLYRTHTNSVSNTHFCEQIQNTKCIASKNLRNSGLLSKKKACIATNWIRNRPTTLRAIDEVEKWLLEIQQANRDKELFPESTFSKTLGREWFRICQKTAKCGSNVWKKYVSSPLRIVRVVRRLEEYELFCRATLKV